MHTQTRVCSLTPIHRIPNTKQNSYTVHKYFSQIVTVTLQTKRYRQCFLQLTFKALHHLIYPAQSAFILLRRTLWWLST